MFGVGAFQLRANLANSNAQRGLYRMDVDEYL